MQHKLIRKARVFNQLKEKLKDLTILVEGKRDVKALMIAGIGEGKSIIAMNSQKMEIIARKLSGRKVAILTDYDRTGELKAREAYEELLSFGAYPDLECRRTLKCVLGLYRIEEIKQRYGISKRNSQM